jgi:Flp pilus assembly protein TadG
MKSSSNLPNRERGTASPNINNMNRGTRRRGANVAARLINVRLRDGLHEGLGESSETGAAMVEMALVLPVLMLMVTGIFAFGTAFNNYVALTNAVDISGRLLAIDRLNTTDPCADVANAVRRAAPYLKPANLSFTIVLNTTTYGGTSGTSGTSCSSSSATTGAAANLVQGQPVTVTVTYPCSFGVYGMNLVPGCTLTAQVTELEQ